MGQSAMAEEPVVQKPKRGLLGRIPRKAGEAVKKTIDVTKKFSPEFRRFLDWYSEGFSRPMSTFRFVPSSEAELTEFLAQVRENARENGLKGEKVDQLVQKIRESTSVDSGKATRKIVRLSMAETEAYVRAIFQKSTFTMDQAPKAAMTLISSYFKQSGALRCSELLTEMTKKGVFELEALQTYFFEQSVRFADRFILGAVDEVLTSSEVGAEEISRIKSEVKTAMTEAGDRSLTFEKFLQTDLEVVLGESGLESKQVQEIRAKIMEVTRKNRSFAMLYDIWGASLDPQAFKRAWKAAEAGDSRKLGRILKSEVRFNWGKIKSGFVETAKFIPKKVVSGLERLSKAGARKRFTIPLLFLAAYAAGEEMFGILDRETIGEPDKSAEDILAESQLKHYFAALNSKVKAMGSEGLEGELKRAYMEKIDQFTKKVEEIREKGKGSLRTIASQLSNLVGLLSDQRKIVAAAEASEDKDIIESTLSELEIVGDHFKKKYSGKKTTTLVTDKRQAMGSKVVQETKSQLGLVTLKVKITQLIASIKEDYGDKSAKLFRDLWNTKKKSKDPKDLEAFIQRLEYFSSNGKEPETAMQEAIDYNSSEIQRMLGELEVSKEKKKLEKRFEKLDKIKSLVDKEKESVEILSEVQTLLQKQEEAEAARAAEEAAAKEAEEVEIEPVDVSEEPIETQIEVSESLSSRFPPKAAVFLQEHLRSEVIESAADLDFLDSAIKSAIGDGKKDEELLTVVQYLWKHRNARTKGAEAIKKIPKSELLGDQYVRFINLAKPLWK